MRLTRESFLRACGVAWDISHDPTKKTMALDYDPRLDWLRMELRLNGEDVDTTYVLHEKLSSYFMQNCDVDDTLEHLEYLVKE